MTLNLLKGMKNALVMAGLWEDCGDNGAIVLAQIGDDDLWVIAFGA